LWPGAYGWIVGLAVIYGLSDHLFQLLQATGRLVHAALGSLVRAVVLVSGAAACLSGWLPKEPAVVLQVEIVSYIGMAAWALAGLGGVRWGPFRPDRVWTGRLVGYSWSMILCMAAGYVTNWIDLYIIKWYAPLEEVGVYAVAYQIMQYLSNGLMTFSVVFFPRLVTWWLKERREEMQVYLQQLTPQVAMGWTLLLLAGAAVAPSVAQLGVGDRYLAAVGPLLVLCVGLQFQTLAVMTTGIYSAHGWLPMVTLLNVGMAAANVSLDLLLVPLWGMWGAAVATASVYAGTSAAYLLVAQRRLGVAAWRALSFPAVGAVGVALAATPVVPAAGRWTALAVAAVVVAAAGYRWGLWRGVQFGPVEETPAVVLAPAAGDLAGARLS
jgi:O-antigen/teichoic acid export membrane protein